MTSRKVTPLPQALLPLLTQQLTETAVRQPVSRWVVAYSGGLDSTVLLHALAQLTPSQPVLALHINHQLSQYADQWQLQAQSFCQSLGLEFRAERVDVVESGRGLEDAARRARYEVFERTLESGDVLLMAHHSDDQVETMLLRLMRGTGPEGLAGIKAERSLAAGRLLRPLLSMTRLQLEGYAAAAKLSWVEDDSNSDTRFDRNYLRAEILPQLAQRWPGFQSRWQQAADHCDNLVGAQSQVLDDLLSRCDASRERWGQSVDLKAVTELEASQQLSLLRHWLQGQSLNPELAQLQQLQQQIVLGRADAAAEIQIGSGRLRRSNGRVYLTGALPELPSAGLGFDLNLQNGAASLALPLGELRVSVERELPQPYQSLRVQFRRGGERCQPYQRRRSQTLKKLLQEYQLEAWLRPFVPLVYAGDELVAVADLWKCTKFVEACGDSAITCHWQLQCSGD